MNRHIARVRTMAVGTAVFLLGASAFAAPATAFAQWDGNVGYGDVYSPTPSYVDSIDYSSPAAAPSYVGSVDYSSPAASPSYVGSVDYTSPASYPSYVGSIDYTSPAATPSYVGSIDYISPASRPSYSYSPSYSAPSNYYSSSYSSSYSAAPFYSASAPSYATQFVPSAVAAAPFVPQVIPSAPIFAAASIPSANTNVNTVVPTNTNVNAPSYTITNAPVDTASVAPITNTNTASTGAINNTFAPVINVNAGPMQQLAQAVLQAPTCAIYAGAGYASSYGYNSPTTLTWSSYGATSAYISPSVGTVQTVGSTTVYPQGYTTYTMTVYGPGGSANCQATANYATSYAPPAAYPASPATPYVSLTQIPYTGFDFGPWGNALYWAALLALAASAAYLLIYYLPSQITLGFAGAGAAGASDANPEVAEVFKHPLSSPSIATVLDESAPAPAALPTVERRRVTTDSMVIDHSSGAPRIVIARE